jgi:ankyrin repeat protein
MWATGQAANVRLLIDHGADVNAKAKSGTTALLTATRRANPEALKLLVARGANPKVGTEDGSDLLKAAYPGFAPVTNGARTNPEVVRVLADAGVTLQSARQPGQLPLLAGLGDTTVLNRLLDAGANPNDAVAAPAQSIPILQFGVAAGDRDFVRTLVERGADPNGKSGRDVTALMVAVNAPRPDPAMVRLLMEKAADVNARDKSGRTVLDWAMMQGETGIALMLRQAGAASGSGPSPAPQAISIPRTTRVAMERAIPRLQPIGPAFSKQRPCISCHNQSLPSIAVKLAGSHGIAVDADLAKNPSKATLASWGAQRGNLMTGLEAGIGGFIENTTYGLWGLAEESVPANSTTDAVIYRLLELQKADGSWQEFDLRPPLGGISPIKFTALAIRGVDAYAPPALKEDARAGIARAREYLRKATPEDTQDEAFRLLGLVWSGAPAAEVAWAVMALAGSL